jgi:hypothetical protein
MVIEHDCIGRSIASEALGRRMVSGSSWSVVSYCLTSEFSLALVHTHWSFVRFVKRVLRLAFIYSYRRYTYVLTWHHMSAITIEAVQLI